MMKKTVLVTGRTLAPEALAILSGAGLEVAFMEEPVTEARLVERFGQGPVEAMILRGPRPVTAAVLAAAKDLRIIAKNGAGVDSVDLAEASRRGIVVAVAAGANAEAVAEHALSMMLSLTKNLGGLDRKVRAGGWEDSTYLGRDFRGSTVGLVGFGAIGRATARLASALGAKVRVWRRAGGRAIEGFDSTDDLDELLAGSDILSLHCPLTTETRGLIGAREIALMKPGALIVNTARGPVIDEAALVEALREGRLAGAGLDTFDAEPLPVDSPLRSLDNLILTPHVAGVTRDAARRVATMTAQHVVDALAGRPLPADRLVSAA